MVDVDADGVYAVCAKDQGKGALVIANITASDIEFTLDGISNIDKCYLTSDGKMNQEITLPNALEKESFLVITFRQ
jgi:hypothetical protein